MLRQAKYRPLAPDEHGIIRSEAYPGLWLNVRVLLVDEMAAVMATLQQGLASDERAAFVARLAATTGPPAPTTNE